MFVYLGLRDFNPCLLLASATTLEPSGNIGTRSFRDATVTRIQKQFDRAKMFDKYYNVRHKVDDSNNLRQGLFDSLMHVTHINLMWNFLEGARSIETAWGTKDWHMRTLGFLWALAEANAWSATQYFAPEMYTSRQHQQFRRNLAANLVDGLMQTSATLMPDSRCKLKQHDPIPGKVKIVRTGTTTHEYPVYPQPLCKHKPDGKNQCGARTRLFCACSPGVDRCLDCFLLHQQ